ncbi:MAG: hypothetical protein DMF43_00495 [Verrucomicrobia bacterium]|nr:MAG: hypothetical protein DMF43_00495 [Verrucomicrobiota bacterium]
MYAAIFAVRGRGNLIGARIVTRVARVSMPRAKLSICYIESALASCLDLVCCCKLEHRRLKAK